jgi:hypothetical protein
MLSDTVLVTSPVRQLVYAQRPGTLKRLMRHADIFSQQRLDAEKHFQTFAHGIVGYFFLLQTALPSEALAL